MTESHELRAAWVTVLLLVVGYAIFTRFGTPSPSAPAGHALGIIGTLLMVGTETLYSIRKRTDWIRVGQLRAWLSVHIYMGIVGPTLALLHTAWKFQGLAGLTMLLTVVVVISGFVGRYIYTSVPRSMSGAVVEYQQLTAQLSRLDEKLQSWLAQEPAHVRELIQRAAIGRQPLSTAGGASRRGIVSVLGRTWDEWNYRRQVRRALEQEGAVEMSQWHEIGRLLRRRHRLERQVNSVAAARRLMAQWRLAHVPLGTALFTAIGLHVVAALVFSTFAR